MFRETRVGEQESIAWSITSTECRDDIEPLITSDGVVSSFARELAPLWSASSGSTAVSGPEDVSLGSSEAVTSSTETASIEAVSSAS